MSRAVASTDAASMSTQVTLAPSSAKRIAVARPIPDPAPVTMATLPASRSPTAFLLGRARGIRGRCPSALRYSFLTRGVPGLVIHGRPNRNLRRRVPQDGFRVESNAGIAGRRAPAPAGVRAGTPAGDEDILQLRRLVHDHLHPVGLSHAVR